MPATGRPATEAFASAMTALGGSVVRLTSGSQAADHIEGVVRRHSDSASLLYEPGGLIDDLGLHLALRARGVRMVSVSEAGDAAELSVGMTCAELAIATSGTLMVGGQAGGWGLAAALPWVHVALVRERDIEVDLQAAFPRFAAAFHAGERNWVWISGPSKTGDIAMKLVTGVHGPNTLEVIVVADGAETGP